MRDVSYSYLKREYVWRLVLPRNVRKYSTRVCTRAFYCSCSIKLLITLYELFALEEITETVLSINMSLQVLHNFNFSSTSKSERAIRNNIDIANRGIFTTGMKTK